MEELEMIFFILGLNCFGYVSY